MSSQTRYYINLSTVKPVLTTTSEQRPPVYNGQPDPQLFNIDRNDQPLNQAPQTRGLHAALEGVQCGPRST